MPRLKRPLIFAAAAPLSALKRAGAAWPALAKAQARSESECGDAPAAAVAPAAAI